VQGKGQESDGGSIDFQTSGEQELHSIDAHGGANAYEGDVTASAWCSLTLLGGRTIDTTGPPGPSDLVSVDLSAGGLITIAGSIKTANRTLLSFRDQQPVVTGAVTGTATPPLQLVPDPRRHRGPRLGQSLD
jgi:hypothetical protein